MLEPKIGNDDELEHQTGRVNVPSANRQLHPVPDTQYLTPSSIHGQTYNLKATTYIYHLWPITYTWHSTATTHYPLSTTYFAVLRTFGISNRYT